MFVYFKYFLYICIMSENNISFDNGNNRLIFKDSKTFKNPNSDEIEVIILDFTEDESSVFYLSLDNAELLRQHLNKILDK